MRFPTAPSWSASPRKHSETLLEKARVINRLCEVTNDANSISTPHATVIEELSKSV